MAATQIASKNGHMAGSGDDIESQEDGTDGYINIRGRRFTQKGSQTGIRRPILQTELQLETAFQQWIRSCIHLL